MGWNGYISHPGKRNIIDWRVPNRRGYVIVPRMVFFCWDKSWSLMEMIRDSRKKSVIDMKEYHPNLLLQCKKHPKKLNDEILSEILFALLSYCLWLWQLMKKRPLINELCHIFPCYIGAGAILLIKIVNIGGSVGMLKLFLGLALGETPSWELIPWLKEQYPPVWIG